MIASVPGLKFQDSSYSLVNNRENYGALDPEGTGNYFIP